MGTKKKNFRAARAAGRRKAQKGEKGGKKDEDLTGKKSEGKKMKRRLTQDEDENGKSNYRIRKILSVNSLKTKTGNYIFARLSP